MFLFIRKALIRVCGAQADLQLCWSHASRCTYRRVVREANSDMSSLKENPSKVKLLSYKTFPSKKTYGLTVHENQWNVNKANSEMSLFLFSNSQPPSGAITLN